LICGASVGLFKQAAFGVDPFQCLCNGLHHVIPMDFGTLYVIINVVLLVLVFFMNRRFIGLGTFINLFLLGYVIDGSEKLIFALMGEPTMALRIVYIVIGMIVLCFSASVYMTADMGVSTYDAIALHLAEKKIAPFRFIRIATDLTCVFAGWALGFIPGVGTVLTALCMGPLVSFFNERFSKPMLYGREHQTA
ncbi:MAG: DUF6198 family protein, partial [Eubacteriales bacterium]|nr:DUF6198 family protein [Eubacteriales bacterium]